MHRNEIILIHYSTFIFLYSAKALGLRMISRIICRILQQSAGRNVIFFEVNDLPYEQSIDLETAPNRLNIFDHEVFAVKNINFIFAASEMSKYAANLYMLNKKNTSFLINGAWPIKNNSNNKKEINFNLKANGLKFIYAGTLNRGRQINEMINVFVGSSHSLILIGKDGEWISKEFKNEENIIYLGAFDEDHAHHIVKECDVGIIPYSETRSYYNICYPTKASFYASAGLPMLSPPLKELMNHHTEECNFFLPLRDWRSLISNSDLHSMVDTKRHNITPEIQSTFLWENIWREWSLQHSPHSM